MKSLPPLAFRKHLESISSEITAGDWRIGTYVDLVSEKKYLLFRLKPDRFSQVRPDIITFRAETAVALAPDGCVHIAETEWKNDRLDVLTPFLEPVDPGAIGDADAASLLRTVVKTLAVFERLSFLETELELIASELTEEEGQQYFRHL